MWLPGLLQSETMWLKMRKSCARQDNAPWFKLAAAQGFAAAFHVVGLFFQEGYGVSADIAKAICWYKRAAAAGHDGAARVLRRLQSNGA